MQAQNTSLRPLERTGNSANIVYYRERGGRPDEPYVWVEVLHAMPWRRAGDGRLRLDRSQPDTYHLRIRERNGSAHEVEARYSPKRRTGAELPPRTVSRLVRKALARCG